MELKKFPNSTLKTPNSKLLKGVIDLNTLIAVAIAPVGTGSELSGDVAEVVKVIRESGLPNRTYSMFTEIEGDWDEVMAVVKRATFVLAEKGIRTEVVLKADIRPGFVGMMDGKLTRLAQALDEDSTPHLVAKTKAKLLEVVR